MKVLAVLLLAVCAASAAAVESVKVERHGGNFAYSVEQGVVPQPYVAPTPYVAQPYVAPYVNPYVAPVVAKVDHGKPVVSTYTAGAYPYHVGAYPYAYGYPYGHAPVAPVAYTYPYGSPYHTVPVVAKPEKVE